MHHSKWYFSVAKSRCVDMFVVGEPQHELDLGLYVAEV